MSRCVQCGGRATTLHHVLPRQNIKREYPQGFAVLVSGRRVPRGDLLADRRNLIPMCLTPCHLDHENWARRLWRDQIPPSAWEFAAELGGWATVALERAYPVRARPDNSSRDPDPLGARDP